MARYVGLLYFADPRPADKRPGTTGGVRIATGTLIGPRHVLTAAHCITHNLQELRERGDAPYPGDADTNYEDFPPLGSIYFAPGHNGDIEFSGDRQRPDFRTITPASHPFGRFAAQGLYLSHKYRDSSKKDSAPHDVAIVVLEEDASIAVGGFARLDTLASFARDPGKLMRLPKDSTYFRFSGYDNSVGTTRDGYEVLSCRQQFRKGAVQSGPNVPAGGFFGELLESVRRTPDQLLLYTSNVKAGPGASGGPTWLELKDGTPIVVGIMTSTIKDEAAARWNGCARGILFDSGYLDWIKGGMGD